MGNALHVLLFQPPPVTYSNDGNLIWLTTRCGSRIPAFYLNNRASITILFSHGNAEDLGEILEYFEYFGPHINANVFAYDYTGYGLGTGEPSEEDMYADIEAAFLYLRDTLSVPWESIVLFGRSMGSAASTYLASRTPVRGLILQCPMLSVYRIMVNLRFSLPGDCLASVDRVKQIEAPVFVIHGSRDEVVPFWHGEELFRLCKDKSFPPYWVLDGTHNEIEEMNKEMFLMKVNLFLDHLRTSVIPESLRNQSTSL